MYRLVLLILVQLGGPSEAQVNPHIASEKAKLAHRYHGILHSISDPEKGDYFVRNNRRCKLYTKAFEAWLQRKEKKQR